MAFVVVLPFCFRSTVAGTVTYPQEGRGGGVFDHRRDEKPDIWSKSG